MLKKNFFGQGKYVKAKTPEAKKKQKAAIINFYVQKHTEEKRKTNRGNREDKIK